MRVNQILGPVLVVLSLAAGVPAIAQTPPYETETVVEVSPPGAHPYGTERTVIFSTTRVDGPGTPLGSVMLEAGGESLPVPVSGEVSLNDIPAGLHTVTADYGGSSEDLPSSGSDDFEIVRAETSIVLDAPAEVAIGEPFDIRIELDTLLAPYGAPIEVLVGGDISYGMLSNGEGSESLELYTPGEHTISVTYDGDENHLGSSAQITVTVTNSDYTSTTLAATDPSVRPGDDVILTASVETGSGGEATGNIDLFEDGMLVATESMSGGYATFVIADIAEGVYTYSARYSGEGTFLPSTSPEIEVTASSSALANASILLTPSFQTVRPDDNAEIEVQVYSEDSADGVIPTGTVDLQLDGTSLSSAELVEGRATLVAPMWDVGRYDVSVHYHGDALHEASLELATIVVEDDLLTPTLSTTVTPGSPTTNDSISIGVDVDGTSSVPTGDLTAYVNGMSFASVSLVDGQGNLALGQFSEGSYQITIVYSGDAEYSTQTESFTLEVAAASSEIGLSVAPETVRVGSSFTVTADILVDGAPAESGEVTFYRDWVVIGEYPVIEGAAEHTVDGLAYGTYEFTASYLGGGTAVVAPGVTVNVAKWPTTLTLESEGNPSQFGASTDVVATVDTAGQGSPTGSVRFAHDGGTFDVPLVDGVARFPVDDLPVGSHTITATYSGDDKFAGSSDSLVQEIAAIPVTLTLTQDKATSQRGEEVKLTVSLTADGSTPTGAVEILVDGDAVEIDMDNGSGTHTLGDLAVGSHVFVATYAGDATHASATTNQVLHEVAAALTQVDLATTPASSVVGQAVGITATVDSAYGVPSGSAELVVDGTVVGTKALDESGVVVFDWTGTSAGEHEIQVRFTADGIDHEDADSDVIHYDVAAASTTLTIDLEDGPHIEGQTQRVRFVVGVDAPGAGIPTGEVEVTIGDTVERVALSAGAAGFDIEGLEAGSHRIDAQYLGDGNFLGSNASVNMTVLPPSAGEDTVTTVSMAADSIVGDAVGVDIDVALQSGGAVESGDVEVLVDGVVTETLSIVDGKAGTEITFSEAGTYEIRARYLGVEGEYISSMSATVSHRVDPNVVATATAVTASPAPSQIGEAVTITAEVTADDGAAVNEGAVSFSIDGAVHATIAVSDGVATSTWTGNVSGTVEISASYGGTDRLEASASPVLQHTVEVPSSLGTVTTLSVDKTTSEVDEFVLFTAEVVDADGSPVSAGSVALVVDGTRVGIGLLEDGTATISWKGIEPGDVTFVAEYLGIEGLDPSVSGAVTVNVVAVGVLEPTNTALEASPAAPWQGETVRLAATVFAATGTATGTVSFSIDGSSIGTATLSGGLASFDWTPSTSGTFAIEAVYAGSTAHAASSSGGRNITVAEVTPASTRTILGIDKAESTVGETISLGVTVEGGDGSPVSGGQVRFSVDGAVFATMPVVDGKSATTWTSTEAGTFAFQAQFMGDGALNPSSSVEIVHEVTPAAAASTSTVLDASPDIVGVGATVNLWANVTSGAGVPDGEVAFVVDGDEVGRVDLVNGKARFYWTAAGAGTFAVEAIYSGSEDYLTSSSSLVEVEVREESGPAAVVTVKALDLDPLDGDRVTLEAVVGAASGTPGGTVTFAVDGEISAAIPLVDGTARFITDPLPAGTYEVVVVYNGDSLFTGAISPPYDLIVSERTGTGPVNTKTTLSASAADAWIGESVVYTASVTAEGSTPAGSVVFEIDGAPVATVALTDGKAVWTTSFAATGDHVVRAFYQGDADHRASDSSAVSLAVRDPADEGTIAVDIVLDGGNGVLNLVSDTAGLSGEIWVNDGRGRFGPLRVPAGHHDFRVEGFAGLGYVLSSVICSDGTQGGSDGSVAVDLDAGEALVCTFTAAEVREQTVEMIEGMLAARGGTIVSNLPDAGRRIGRLNGNVPARFDINAFLSSYAQAFEAGGPIRVSSSLGAIEGATGAQEMGALDVWFEAAGGVLSHGGAEGSYGIVSGGIDVLVGADVLLGSMVMVDGISLEDGAGKITGTGAMAGPYLTMRVGEGVYLDLMALAGGSWNDISPTGTYTDRTMGGRFLVDANLQGQWSEGPWTFGPRLGVTYFEETLSGYVDGNGIEIPAVTSGRGTTAAGFDVEYGFGLNGMSASIGGGFDLAADIEEIDGTLEIVDPRGRVEGGFGLGLPQGGNLDFTLSYDGLGTENHAIGGRVGLKVPLD